MKLSPIDIAALRVILTTCNSADIDAVIIEDGVIRGINEARTCAIISSVNVPNLGNQKMGMTRLSALKARLDLLGDGAAVDAKETDRGEISQLEMSSGKNRAQYRCTSSALIKAPKSINDTPVYAVQINKEQLQLVFYGLRVYGAKTVCVAIRKDGVTSIEAKDTNNDVFSVTLDTVAEMVGGDGADSVANYYAADVFSALLKAPQDAVSIIIGAAGTLTVTVNEHCMTVLPQVTGDE